MSLNISNANGSGADDADSDRVEHLWKKGKPDNGDGKAPSGDETVGMRPKDADASAAPFENAMRNAIAKECREFMERVDDALIVLQQSLGAVDYRLRNVVGAPEIATFVHRHTVDSHIDAIEACERKIFRLAELLEESGPFGVVEALEVLQEIRQDFLVDLMLLGIETFHASPGDSFDHCLHSPRQIASTEDFAMDGRIASQVRPGYWWTNNHTVIRKAVVRLFKIVPNQGVQQ